MSLRMLRPLLIAAAFFVFPALAAAQAIPTLPGGQRPTPEQARALLQARPDLIQQLQQRLQTSGLTPDQVRARLRAEGYPEDLLDQYLSGAGASGGGRGRPAPNAETLLGAMEALGIADSLDLDVLRRDARGTGRDSLGRRPTAALPTGARDFIADTLRPIPNPTGRIPDTTAAARGSSRARRDSLVRSALDRYGLTREELALQGDSALTAGEARAARDSGLVIFGLDLFRNESSLFDANVGGPVDANYRLGPGDRLVLILTGDVEQSYNLQVTREGFVLVPQVGQLYVANLTLAQLEDLLYSRLGRVYSGVRRGGGTTRFSVSVAQLRSNQIFVVGDVLRPGSYRVSSAGTALTALYSAGGPSEAGSLRRVEVRRGGQTVSTLDVYDYLLRGDASRDVRLQNGDVVFVGPRLARVRALGEVLRPATYELDRGETLADLLRSAGGFTAVAAPRQITIERVLPPAERVAGGRDRVVLTVNASDLASVPALRLVNGDVVRVSRIAERVRNRVAVRGNVWNPGQIGFRPGLTLSEALRDAGGLKPDTYLGRVLVSRLRPDSSRQQLRAILRDTTGAVYEDLVLQDEDEVLVFSTSTFRPDRYVAIGGAVQRGGRFQYREGMTLRDLVLLAGGLREGALLSEAEVARLPETRVNGVTARTFRVALDSTYLFERFGAAGTRDYVGVPGVAATAAGAAEVPLQPYDNVLILRQPDFELQRTVFIGGEVRFPGRYALRQKTERLSDLLSRAGGLTAEGYADGVVFFREQANTGRVGLDLPRVLREPRDRDNLILQDGDSIQVPAFNPIVRVAGAVNAPGAVAFVPGQSLDFYVRAGGGGARNADLSRAYVRQPNGKVESVRRRRLFPDALPAPRAGAEVFVPERSALDQVTVAQQIGLVAQIAGTIATLLTAIAVATRR